jgi:hypothetical protein
MDGQGSPAWVEVEDDPPGFDGAYLKNLMTVTNVVVTAIVGVAAAIVLAQPTIRTAMHLGSLAPAWLAGTWPITVAITRRVLGDAPRSSPLLVAFFVHGIAACGSFGAASTVTVSAGWTLLLVIPSSWAFAFPHNRALLVSLLLVPPIERALLAPRIDVSSIAYAGVLGIGAAASFIVLSRRRLRLRAQEARRLEGARLGASRSDDAAAFLAAMRVHDGLSGALMLAQTKAASGSALEAARAFVDKARLVMASWNIEGASAEVQDIVIELIANEARHGGGVARPRVTVGRTRTRIELQVQAPSAPRGNGRGTRNLARRVAASGGRIRMAEKAGFTTTTIEIPHGLGSRVEGTLVHAAPPIVTYLWSGDLVVVGVMGALAIVLIIVANVVNSNVARAHDERHGAMREQIEVAARPTLARVRDDLRERLGCIESAIGTGRADDVRTQLDECSRWMQALLRSLEAAEVSSQISRASPGEALPVPLAGGS